MGASKMADHRSLKLLLILAWINSVVSQGFSDCSFDLVGGVVDSCNIIQDVKNFAVESWRFGSGAGAFFIGGPTKDNSAAEIGGYGFTLTKDMLDTRQHHKKSWMLTGIVSNSTEGASRCLSFAYSMEGLNLKSFEVRLISFEGTIEDVFVNDTILPSAQYLSTTLWKETDSTQGEWKSTSVSFTASGTYSLAFVGEPTSSHSANYGYIAVDDIVFTDGPCGNDCMFDFDTCSWTNADTDDDFDWSLGRGSFKAGTGPISNQASYLNSEIDTGGYAFIDSGYPRRFGDTARLVSNVLSTTDPLCINFWLNMYGGGIGDIRLLLQSETNANETKEIWKIGKGDGNTGSGTYSWYLAQKTVFSQDPFRLIFEASVGDPGYSDTALDTITFDNEPCPSIPLSSHSGWGDCNFMYNTCDWELPKEGHSSCSMLERITENTYNPPGHTLREFDLADSYMRFDLDCYYNQPREEAALQSKSFSSDKPQCLSFWTYMFTVVPTHTKFGALSVVVTDNGGKNKTIWRLQNIQQSGWTYGRVVIPSGTSMRVSFVGTKGPDRSGMMALDDVAVYEDDCSVLPPQALSGPVDCTFDSSLCQYTVFNPVDNSDLPTLNWRLADGSGLNVLIDHTFEADEGGFMFIDSLNADLKSHLRSPSLSENTTYCFTFYFAAFYSDNAATLSVYSDTNGNSARLWSGTQAMLPPRPATSIHVDWHYAQVEIPQQDSSFQIYIEGEVRVGGWAIDDIKLYEDGKDCKIRPEEAVPVP